MSNQLVISIMADDRPGIVEQIAAIISGCNGNWLESALSRLGGKFAGIVLIDIPADQTSAMEEKLSALKNQGIRAAIDHAGNQLINGESITFEVLGNDRKGIVGEISHVLAKHGVSVDELYTSAENAPMSGELLFRATAHVIIPDGMDHEDLRDMLEELSDDLVVEFFEG